MSVSQNFPNIAPSLSLDFANVKALDSRVTFTRASSARYYNGVTTTKAEENLLIRSQEFNTGWTVGRTSVTANSAVAPDGTSTAETLSETAVSGTHIIAQNSSVTGGLDYTQSVFVKKGTGATAPDIFQLGFLSSGFTGDRYANFDISVGGGTSGTVTDSTGGTASISDAGNGWWRCVFTSTATASSTTGGVFFAFTDNNPTATRQPSYLGVVTSDAFIWGAQLEQRSTATAYTPTTTQPITNYIPTLLTATDNVARFDHNPTTGESLGLLIEELRTNLVLRSEEFDNASWAKINSSVTANAVVAPDGALTGDLLIPNTTNAQHRLDQTPTSTTTSQTFSVYAKAGGYNFVGLRIGTFGTSFNLSTGAVSINESGSVGSITAVGNGWYRCSIVVAAAAANDIARINVADAASPSSSITGDGYSGIYIWGAQLE